MFFVAFQSPQNRIEAAPLRFFACPKRRQSTNMCVGSSELYKRLLLGTVLLLLSQSSHYILPFQKSRLRAPHGVRFSCSPLLEIQKLLKNWLTFSEALVSAFHFPNVVRIQKSKLLQAMCSASPPHVSQCLRSKSKIATKPMF
jgi:hypothetical protein